MLSASPACADLASWSGTLSTMTRGCDVRLDPKSEYARRQLGGEELKEAVVEVFGVGQEPDEREAWRDGLLWHPEVPTDLSYAALQVVLAECRQRRLRPVRLLISVGDISIATTVVDPRPVPSLARVLEVKVGEWRHDDGDGRWCVECAGGERLGSI